MLFVSGTDEYGTPISVASEKEGITPQELVDKNSAIIRKDLYDLGISYDLFTRTTTKNHETVVHKIFQGLFEQGLIKEQQSIGAFTGSRALPDRYVEGTCPHCKFTDARGDQCDQCGQQLDVTDLIDPVSKIDGKTPDFRPTKHLFLDIPSVGTKLKEFVASNDWRPNVDSTAKEFVSNLVERSITRDLDWGVSVPFENYDAKRFYVWFDAVIGYLSASIEWASKQGDPELWREWWQSDSHHAYFLGKDNIIFHTIIWPAILAGYDGELGKLRLPDDVVASEFLQIEGKKFSSSRGVVIYVKDILENYSADSIRYYLTAAGPETRDADFTWETFVSRNNDELVANWGNLVQRTLKLTTKAFGEIPEPGTLLDQDKALLAEINQGFQEVGELIEKQKFKAALASCFRLSSSVNVFFDKEQPWKLVKEDPERAKTVLWTVISAISDLRLLLAPFLPFSCQILHETLGFGGDLSRQGVLGEVLELTKHQTGAWQHQDVLIGHKLEPRQLFAKLAPDTAAKELAKLGN